MDELCWGTFTRKSGDEGRWNWFIDTLDPHRVQQTVSNFPLMEPLVPLPDPRTEYWLDSSTSTTHNLSSSFESGKCSNNDMEVSSKQSNHFELNQDDLVRVSRRESISFASRNMKPLTDDVRYSPAFILPLMLGALESTVVETGDSNTSKQFVEMVYNLCCKGSLSLTLASFCCRCPDLRQIAAAILGLILRAMQTPEAHNLDEWKERPQLKLVINSIQRAMVKRKEDQLLQQKEENERGIASTDVSKHFFVPMLPAVGAVFLAKAAWILNAPGDRMYPTINRYFLRLEADHGAYVDGSSLPIFVALYCSQAGDNATAREERLWALRFLSEVVLDDRCYRAAAFRRVPELLMTSFGALANRGEGSGDTNEDERLLLLEVLKTLVARGGNAAIRGLTITGGLLSWMQGLVDRMQFKTNLPSHILRQKFLELLLETLHGLRTMIVESTNVNTFGSDFHLLDIAKPVVEICLDAESKLNRNVGSGIILLSSICEILDLICNIDKMNNTNRRTDLVDYRGIPLRLSTEFAKIIQKRVCSFFKSLGSLCCIPVYLVGKEVERIDAQNFCEIALSCLMKYSSSSSSDTNNLICVNIIRRVALLLKVFGHELASSNVVNLILNVRGRVMNCSGGSKIWIDCISHLIQGERKDDMNMQLLKDISRVDW